MNTLSLEQLDAYANAVYEVNVDGTWRDAEAFANDHGALPAALISACNPRSQPLSDAENAARNKGLRRQIESSRCHCLDARGRSEDSRWIEPGFLVQAPIDLIDLWARQWQQHAVLVLRGPAQAPTLRIYSPFSGGKPPQQLANMHLEWVGCGPPAPP